MKPFEILARSEQRARQLHAAQVSDWYRITAKATNGRSSAKVYIYDAIGGWFGVAASDFIREINDLDVDEIELHLNSPGGSAFDGVAIYNALRQHDADITVIVDGLAASAASAIAMAGDTIVMGSGSMMMIHDGDTIAWGNADDLREVADILDKLSDSYAGIYAKKAGGSPADWRTVMKAETWYTAQEAVDAGLADQVDDDATDDDATASFDLSIFAHAGRTQAPPPRAPHMPPAEPVDHHPTTQGDGTMPNISTKGLSERLGVPAEATEEVILAALEEALNERAEPAAAAPAGTVLVDEGTLADLQASAALGRAAHDRQLAADRTAAIEAAVRTGRIPAARAQHWETQLAADPGALEVLNGLPENTAAPMQSTGYAGGMDESTDDDVRNSPAYKNWKVS